MADGNLRRLGVSHLRGSFQVISGRLANKFGSRFGRNTKLLGGVIGPISTPNDYLITVFDEVFNQQRSCRNNTLHGNETETQCAVKLRVLRNRKLLLYSSI